MIYNFSNHGSSIKSGFPGYSAFLEFYAHARDLFLDDIILDFSGVSWFDANLSAVLGGVLSELSKTNNVSFRNFHLSVESVLKKNLFLSNFGLEKAVDHYESTIKYRKFKTTEEKLFKQYLDMELLSKNALPSMSPLLRKKINESIFEIFNNAVIHGRCNNIFSCGQYYYKSGELDFTIVDLGYSIRKNVNLHLQRNLIATDAIKWAVQYGNTTKTGSIPGGLGLKLIREFLRMNGGIIQIVSSDGFWEENKNGCQDRTFNHEFPGTIVNLKFNINDKSSYCLSSEVDSDIIF